MPKLGITYDDVIMITVPHELRQQLVAISVADGYKAEYASVARNLLTLAAEDRIAEMDKRTRQRYEQARLSVDAMFEIQRQQKDDRQRAKAKKQAKTPALG